MLFKIYQLGIFAAVLIANWATDWDPRWWFAILTAFCLSYYLTVWPIWIYDFFMRWQYRLERWLAR